MREMIISELTQALHDLARGFAHYLPRLIVMLILAFVGWVIAYACESVLRSILRLSNSTGCRKMRALPNCWTKPPCLQLRNC